MAQKVGNVMIGMLKRNYLSRYAGITLIIIILLSLVMVSKLYGASYDENGTEEDSVSGRIIVLFDKDVEEQDLNEILRGYETRTEIEKHYGDYALIYVKDDRIHEELINYLGSHPLVKSVQPDGIVSLMQTTNDVYSKAQWAINNPGYYSVFFAGGLQEISAVPDIDMDVTEAWLHMKKENVERKEVVVAIIDTGVDYKHPDLAENIWINEKEIPGDGIDNDNNGYIDDIYGWDFYNNDASVCHYRNDGKTGFTLSRPEDNDDHGTHIAGIIGAVKDNEIGIAGIASNIDIKMMILKINGGPKSTGSISDAISAIKYATMMGADICNISWGTSQYSPALEEVMRESDMLFVTAAGNSGSDNDSEPIYPANFKLDNLISVTFIDAKGKLTEQSNYGKTTVDFAAPGYDILSTVVGSYRTLSGSSMAAPQVSAVAALIYSYDENLYPSAVKELLVKTLKPIDELKNYVKYPGIPSAYQAVLSTGEADRDNLPPIVKLKTVYDKENLLVPVDAYDKGNSGIRVIRWLPGIQNMEDFARGTVGFNIDNGQLKVSKAGTYTLYAGDYAGNETVTVYKVEDDITPPTISAGFTVADDYKTRTVTVRVRDSQSGIKRVKYMEGKKKASDFLPAGAGTEIELNGIKGSFNVKNDGYYTVYAIDYRGNQTVKLINVKTVVSEEIKLTRSEKVMKVGESYTLKAFVKPADSTDVISYISSDEQVAIVSDNGKITALNEGTALITARTSSGLKASCKIIVKRE